MKEISESIYLWVRCGNDIWKKWFSQRANGASEFAQIEERLFDILVAGEVVHGQAVVAQDFVRHIQVRYIKDIDENRQYFKRQTGGTLFGQAEVVKISKGTVLPIQAIDTAGTMLDSEPYVEVVWKQGFLLESVGNLEFFFENGTTK